MNRIAGLPRRNWRDRADEAVRVVTAALRAPGGTRTFHAIQAVSLLELFETGGLACFARVGSGKTDIAACAPTLMAARGFSRPMYIVPGKLLKKTEREFTALRKHWKVAQQYWLYSFTALAQESRAGILDELQPDMLIFDEPGPLRNVMKPTASAVSRRILRYIAARRAAGLPICCVFLGATPARSTILDYAPMLWWALGEGAPVPCTPTGLDDDEVRAWSAYLDGDGTADATAFEKYLSPARDQEAAWDLYRDRVLSTPGVVVSDDTFDDVPLTVHVHRVDPGLEPEFKLLRETWQRPDGWDLADASADVDPDDVNTWSIWGVARQMALGFYYKPDPPPPKEWAGARKAWFRYVRDLIELPGSTYDTERQVRTACERSTTPVPEWERWRDVKDSFRPNPVPVWMSRHALDAVRSWGSAAPGIVWVDHTAFGRKLAEETGWTYYGQGGLSSSGASIEDADGTRTVIASRLANQEGRNLQVFNRGLIMAMPNAACDVEQLIGRKHRQGQTRPVHIDVYASCIEHESSLEKVARGAAKDYRQLGVSQKWLGVDIVKHGSVPYESWAWRSK